MPMQLVDLAEAWRVREQVGGKAAVLSELAACGWPVPPGFVVTAETLTDPALDQLLRAAGARDQIVVTAESTDGRP